MRRQIHPYDQDELIELDKICRDESQLSGINQRDIFAAFWQRNLPMRCVRDIIKRAIAHHIAHGLPLEQCVDPAVFESVMEDVKEVA